MKSIKNILFVLFAMLAFASCEKDDATVTFFPENAHTGTMEVLEPSYELTLADAAKLMETFKWEKSDFGYSASITYTVQMDLVGQNFKNAQDLASVVSADSCAITVAVVNKAMIALQKKYDYPDESTQAMEFRLKSSITEATAPLYSEPIFADIQFYIAFPENIYMIGGDFGSWDWANEGVVEMTPVHSEESSFWCIRYFNANTGFKWAPKKAWKDDFSKQNENEGFSWSDGNAVVATSGMYMVYIDMVKGAITIEPAQIFGIGDCFGGWSSPASPFTIGEKTASIATTTAGNLRIYATSTAGPQDWWKKEFNIYSGKIEYRGAGGDQDGVFAGAGQTVTLDFNAGTGTIQ